MRKFLKVAAIILGVLVLLVVVLVIVGWIYSPGTTPPIADAQGKVLPNSIANQEKVVLGGVEQWILIRGKDRNKPVLLFLHGGPGSPEMAMFQAFNKELEEHFVVVNWDQRGSGKSYSAHIPDSTFTIRHFVSDTHELVALLRKRFKQEKIYLLGHSWGTVLGVLAVKENPEPFHAYIGVGQVANMEEGERISYDFVLNTARQSNNEEAVKELEEIGPPPYQSLAPLLKERNWVTAFGGAWYGNDSMLDIAYPMLVAQEYTLADKVNYLLGSLRTLNLLWPELMAVNLFEQAPELGVPVYIFQGVHDYQTPYVVAQQYVRQLKAPRKTLFTFSTTAHSPMYEHPKTFHRLLLQNVLAEVEATEAVVER